MEMESMEGSADRRISELLLTIVTAFCASFSINLLTGAIDSWSRNDFTYDPLYLIAVVGFPVITFALIWKLTRLMREVEFKAICQFLIDKTQGEVPFWQFESHNNERHPYKPQTYLANAFVMMKVMLQLRGLTSETRIRQRIVDAYSLTEGATDNPVSDLIDCIIVQHLQDSGYMADDYGFTQSKLMVIHDRTEGAIGGFKARKLTEEETGAIPAGNLPPGLLAARLMGTFSPDSRSVLVRVPKNMRIEDISKGETRGMGISGTGVRLEITHKHLRNLSSEDTGLFVLSPTGQVDTSAIVDQFEMQAKLKMTILGYLRYRETFKRLVRWAERFCKEIWFQFDWPSFSQRNQIAEATRLVPNLSSDSRHETEQE